MRCLPALLGAMLLLLGNVAVGHAATAFFYSEKEQYYGWAAGYNYSRSENEAHKNCNQGGTDCKFVLECDGGWGAVAFADGFARGVAFSCGYANAISARLAAIINCVAASKTLCWTSSTISNNGKQRSDKDNNDFDMAWYVQQMLYMRGFDITKTDGEAGKQTRAALIAFRTALGLQPNGTLDNTIFERLLDAIGGRLVMAKLFKEQLVDPNAADYAKHVYVWASQPYAGNSLSEEIAGRPEDARSLSLATLLTIWGTPCTLPAKSAEPLPPDGTGVWIVACNQGEWTVLMSDGSHTIIASGTAPADPGTGNQQPPPAAQAPPAVAPPPETAQPVEVAPAEVEPEEPAAEPAGEATRPPQATPPPPPRTQAPQQRTTTPAQ